MRVTVAGKGVETGEALKVHVAEGLGAISRKYFDRALEARVTFSRDRAFFACDINLHAGRGLSVRAEGEAADAHKAFEVAAEHVAKRLRRYRRRVNDRPRGLADERVAALTGATTALAEADAPVGEPAREVVLRDAPDEDEGDDAPEEADAGEPANGTVVAEAVTEVPLLTVREAVMRLDLSLDPAMVFRNRASGALNVLYRRRDGHLGWVDPQRA